MKASTYNSFKLRADLSKEEVRSLVKKMVERGNELTPQMEDVVDAYMKVDGVHDGADRDTMLARIMSWRKWNEFHSLDLPIEVRDSVLELVLSGDFVIMHEIPLEIRKRAIAAGMTEKELDGE